MKATAKAQAAADAISAKLQSDEGFLEALRADPYGELSGLGIDRELALEFMVGMRLVDLDEVVGYGVSVQCSCTGSKQQGEKISCTTYACSHIPRCKKGQKDLAGMVCR